MHFLVLRIEHMVSGYSIIELYSKPNFAPEFEIECHYIKQGDLEFNQ